MFLGKLLPLLHFFILDNMGWLQVAHVYSMYHFHSLFAIKTVLCVEASNFICAGQHVSVVFPTYHTVFLFQYEPSDFVGKNWKSFIDFGAHFLHLFILFSFLSSQDFERCSIQGVIVTLVLSQVSPCRRLTCFSRSDLLIVLDFDVSVIFYPLSWILRVRRYRFFSFMVDISSVSY